jgi:predicted esterase
MKEGFWNRKSTAFIIIIGLGFLIGLLLYELRIPVSTPQSPPAETIKLTDRQTYLVYLPDGIELGKRYPLVFALSPGANAASMISAWVPAATKHHWIVAASKEFRNGVEFGVTFRQIEAELNDVESSYPIDTTHVILTGLSGGGMGAHAFAKFYPGRVQAVVINTGMMDSVFMTDDYPEWKTAVFLASPTDFRYTEMKRDRSFLEQHRWKTDWIEFEGGHRMAPDTVYEQAADWLDENPW